MTSEKSQKRNVSNGGAPDSGAPRSIDAQKRVLPRQLQTPTDHASGPNPERDRLIEEVERDANWKRWGPYLSERQWGTVREDYSKDGSCWTYFTHEHARSRAYRWGEDGLLGICDRQCRLCFSVALWNGKDAILKERLFGLTGPEGNHGEDVKEQYFYLDSTPTHSYMRALYKYPMSTFPYERLVQENARRGREAPEFEIGDTGVFDAGYWDVEAEYAKGAPDDLLIRLTVSNRSEREETVHVLPQAWFRNTWCWGSAEEERIPRPVMTRMKNDASETEVRAAHETLGRFRWCVDRASDGTHGEMLFTENDTNGVKVFGEKAKDESFVKDAFHERVIRGDESAVNPAQTGTKGAAWFLLRVKPGANVTIRLRLVREDVRPADPLGKEFDAVFAARRAEADRFYSDWRLGDGTPEEKSVARQAYAGLLWSKQFYHFVVKDWLDGDPLQPKPPEERKARGARNTEWRHLYARDVISMPDKWEYPWFAAWDLAFHCVGLSHVDPQFAKEQLLLMMREWYMHPSGAIPAYEFAFGDVNPPVHAWACWRVYKMTGKRGERDRVFLARAFHKLLLNFTWWVNRKDPDGKNIFGGGFLGLDNIGVFDRSNPLPGHSRLEQADGTAWMAFFCGTMLSIALELSSEDPAYEDVASKFFEHFIAIIDAMNAFGGAGLWNEEDGFYYDHLLNDASGESSLPLKVRSIVGIIPILAAEVLEEHTIEKLPGFRKRMNWFLENRPDLGKYVTFMTTETGHEHALVAIPTRERLRRVMAYVMDEREFLSPFGVRSMSKVHSGKPFVLEGLGGEKHTVEYAPGESTTAMFGGNSNWRGPVWMPLNYLLVEALERYHHFYQHTLTVPVRSVDENGRETIREASLEDAAAEIRARLVGIFMANGSGRRAFAEGSVDAARFAQDGAWRDLCLFHEYFHAETGQGLGASHQTGWTALIAPLIKDHTRRRRMRGAGLKSI
jgi:hypothetical protein